MEEKQLKRMHSKKKLAVMVMVLVIATVLALAYYYTEGTKSEMGNTVVLAVCGEVSPTQLELLSARLLEYAPPDERKEIAVELYTFSEDYSDPQGKELLHLIEVMNAGNPNLYLLDQQIYNLLGERVELRELANDHPAAATPESKVLIPLEGLPFWSLSELDQISDCYLAIQRSDTYAVTKDAQTQEYYKYQYALLENIVEDQPGREIGIFG